MRQLTKEWAKAELPNTPPVADPNHKGALNESIPLVSSKRKAVPWSDIIKPLETMLGRRIERGQVLSDLTLDQLQALLEVKDRKIERAIWELADTVTDRFFNKKVFFRGIVEFSNVCQKDCFYCGIRKHQQVKRYTMSKEEIVDCATWAYDAQYGSLMLQSGEMCTDKRVAFLEDVIRTIREKTIAREEEKMRQSQRELKTSSDYDEVGAGTVASANVSQKVSAVRDYGRGLAVALSVGELSTEHYQRLYNAGAHRYLLRIETSNPDLYAQMHPADHSWHTRVKCLHELRRIGFQLGSGVMIGLPGQTMRDLAGDLVFFKNMGVDMIGMGPYILANGTPLAARWLKEHPNADMKAHAKWAFDISVRMVSLARIFLGNANISATTALQAMNPAGREIALTRGANVLMPILTPTKYRENYQLYRDKPCIDEEASDCRGCLTMRVKISGKDIAWGKWGDPKSFFSPVGGDPNLTTTPATDAKISAAEAPKPVASAEEAGITVELEAPVKQVDWFDEDQNPLPTAKGCQGCHKKEKQEKAKSA